MTRAQLIQQIQEKGSYLCVGLDTDLNKMPAHLPKTMEGMLEFNTGIIEATQDLCVAYKPNFAFYEQYGAEGVEVLKETIKLIPDKCLVVADAKRGDIGNTAAAYARAIFDDLGADAVTVAPYMGRDAIEPFLEHKDKWTIVLGLTSNAGAADFQYIGTPSLHEQVISKCAEWGSDEQLMFVIGATRPEDMKRVRALVPSYFFLVPGVGAQGGSLSEVSEAGLNTDCGLLVNSSRGIIYAGKEEDYKEKARAAAQTLADSMRSYLK